LSSPTNLLGKPFTRTHRINLGQLDLPRLDLSDQIAPFSADEVALTELVSLIRHEANDWIAAGFRSFAPLFTPAA